MVKKIDFGKYNKYYNYILFAIIFHLLFNIAYGMNYYDIFIELRFFYTNDQSIFSKHALIHNIFCYFGVFILSIFFFILEKKKYKTNI